MSERHGPVVTADPLVRAVAAHGLPGATLSLPDGPLCDSEWGALLDEVRGRRLVGMLAACAKDGALVVTEAQYEELAQAHAAAMTRIVDIEDVAVETIGVLDQAGIQVRVLKGLAVAHLDLPDPSQREFGDVDLLVEPGAFRRATDALATARLPRDLPERRRGFDERFGKEATFYGRKGVEIDLHRTLALGAFGLALSPASLWDDGEIFRLGSCVVRALRPEGRLLHACYNALLGDRVPRLTALRDVAQLAGRPDLSADALIGLATTGRGGAVVSRAIRLAGDSLGTGRGWALWEWSGSYAPSRWDRAALACYESHGGSNTATLLSGVLALRGIGARWSYVAGLVRPDQAYSDARRRSGRPGEWRRGAQELLRPASIRAGRR